jgi:hypothetical protein
MLRRFLIFTAMSTASLIATAQQDKKVFHDDSTKPIHKYLPDITVVGRVKAITSKCPKL